MNELGMIVHNEWNKTTIIRAEIELGEFVVMPNPIHGIIWIVDGRGTAHRVPALEPFGKPVTGSIPTIVRAFKSAVTRCTNLACNTPGAPVWQRNYYEHIIRDPIASNNIAKYILNNPSQWELDRLNSRGTP